MMKSKKGQKRMKKITRLSNSTLNIDIFCIRGAV